ncbi:MAG: DUF1501 domain-containing protein [Planctomycetaceae bacterium]
MTDRTMSLLSRRHALKLAGGCAAMSAAPVISTLTGLRATNAAWAANPTPDNDYKALVCIYLFGGNDSFNMLVPLEDGEHGDYQQVRGNLALNKDDLLPISDQSGRKFGLHPSMPDIQSLYNDGDAAFVANIGTLVRPTSKADFNQGLHLPKGLFSHPDQTRHWQTSVPQTRAERSGWAGRMADILNDAVNDNPAIGMNIAIDQMNLLQTGRQLLPYVVRPQRLAGYDKQKPFSKIYTSVTDQLLARSYGNAMEQQYANLKRSAIDAASNYSAAVDSVQLQTQFPSTQLGGQLQLAAETIAARDSLNHKRQVFFALVGGWDFHDEVINAQASLLREVNDAIASFQTAMGELGTTDCVATFTASDFGRTLTSNGNGTDHAWGGNVFTVGGALNGGNIFGDYPSSLLDDALDIGRRRLLPTTSVDEYSAELAMWFGIENDNNLEAILPNIRTFYAQGSSTGPLGLF